MKRVIKAKIPLEVSRHKKAGKEAKLVIHQIPKTFRTNDEVAVYTDGGYKKADFDNDQAETVGSAFAVIQRGDSDQHSKGRVVHDKSGLVVLDPQHAEYEGAQVRSDNTAEITAMLRALLWLIKQGDTKRATILFYSMYTASAARG